MNKFTVFKLTPNVLKRMEYCLDRFYLLNFNNDEIWVGNTAAYLIILQMDGVKNLEEIINDLKKEFCDYTFEQIYGSMIKIIQELVEKNFLTIIS